MKHLHLHTEENPVSIAVSGDRLVLTVGGVRPDTPTTPIPLEWSHTLLGGDTTTYKKAEKAIAELGEGWRMPTRQELESLLDLSRHDPAIDTDKYPGTKSTWYWTSTPCAWRDDAVWCVAFGNGDVYYSPRDLSCCVRAVRSGQ